MPYQNGTLVALLPPATWVKSSYSAQGSCVELAALPDGSVAARNSRDPKGHALVYSRAEVAAFLAGAKAGEFDQFAE